MSRFKRRVLTGAGIVLALVVVAGLRFQTTTRSALERAEAFRFRRLLVAQQPEEGTYRFFFATNRGMERESEDLKDRFGSRREAGLRLGYFDTDIELSLGLGMLINPSDWFQNEEIRIRSIRELDAREFVPALRRQVQASASGSLLIQVNGFRERFPSALRKTAFVAHVLDIDSPVLVFDWPGNQGSSPRGYLRAQQVARESGAELAELMRLVLDDIAPERVWLFANSMGAEVVVSAFTELYRDPAFRDAEHELEEVVLTAPDVSHEEFGRQFEDEIDALTRSLTVYVSSNDRALLMSRVLNRERRLGESRIDPANPDQLEEASEAFALVEPDSDEVTLVDVTPVNRTRNFHNFSLETPEFFDDLFLRLIHPDLPRSRPTYRVQTVDGRAYWVLTRGR